MTDEDGEPGRQAERGGEVGMTREDAVKHLENMKWLLGVNNTTVNDIPLTKVIDDIAALLKEQEPVVRCRDCKHYDRRCFTCENDGLLIKIDDCGCHPPFRVDDDWFCADGERRDDDAAD